MCPKINYLYIYYFSKVIVLIFGYYSDVIIFIFGKLKQLQAELDLICIQMKKKNVLPTLCS